MSRNNTMWQAGDIGAETNKALISRLIQAGQLIYGDINWRWNHIFIVTDTDGSTIEAEAAGVIRRSVANRNVLNLGCPSNVDRSKVVEFAESKLGTKYDYFDDVVLGIDCLLHRAFRGNNTNKLICSELAALALEAGGFKDFPLPSSLIKPGDMVDFSKQWND